MKQKAMSEVIDKNRKFYDEYVAGMIHEMFGSYESRIAVGIVGEGSDCFGYDDVISRDHDFGTGVCLWITEEDRAVFGDDLSREYAELVNRKERSYYTGRLSERRGVMTIHDFYSNILQIDCDTKNGRLSEADWYALDHSCLKTATNGQVFRDDLGEFSAFRDLLLRYYPDRVWKRRIAEKLHEYAAALQVNYARCMFRRDTVAAQLCRNIGMSAAMELFFLLKREYPPYYKWTFRALTDLDGTGEYADKIRELADTTINTSAWEHTGYHPNRPNFKDRIVSLAEEIASQIVLMLRENGLTQGGDRYLERYVDELLKVSFSVPADTPRSVPLS